MRVLLVLVQYNRLHSGLNIDQQGHKIGTPRRKLIDIIVNTDGGLLNIPNKTRPYVVWGFIISHPNGAVLANDGLVEGTNNEAEYLGVINGLERCLELGADSVTLRVDSQMVARQLVGEYTVKAANLKSYYKTARRLCRRFSQIEIEWVPREQNHAADKMCHQAMHLWRHQNGHDFKTKQRKGAKK
jgi:ribonuclease HI